MIVDLLLFAEGLTASIDSAIGAVVDSLENYIRLGIEVVKTAADGPVDEYPWWLLLYFHFVAIGLLLEIDGR